MGGRKLSIVFALLAVFSLTGTECFFVARSGSSSSDGEEQDSGLVVVIRDGRLVDAPVEGVEFRSGSLAGITGANGEFQYLAGEPVAFFIGDIALGVAVEGKPVITPLDLVPQGTLDTPAVINIARLLQSLDALPGDTRITIPAALREAAVRTSAEVGSAIRFLDFSDDARFTNAAAQLVATLTAGYPFTGVLVDAQSARTHLRDSLPSAGISVPAGQDLSR
jgi:hypothetical protein